jgi:hypothetical protein
MSDKNSEKKSEERVDEIRQRLIRRDKATIRKKRIRVIVVVSLILLAIASYFLIPNVIIPEIKRNQTYYLLKNHPEQIKVGDVIVFGSNEVNDTWQVLAVDGSRILLINEKTILDLPFIDVYVKSQARYYSIYEWLDEIYYAKVFNSREKALIAETDGNYAFLLTWDDVNTYLPSNTSRITGDYGNYTNEWWLGARDKSKLYEDQMYVSTAGYINESGAYPHKALGVRPAIWLDLG